MLLILGIHSFTLPIYILISITSILFLFLNKSNIDDGNLFKYEINYFSLILLVGFIFSFFVFQCPNLSPVLKDGNTLINRDLVFWFRNAVAATKAYPLPELSVMGKDLYYHYFTSLEIAFLHFVTGIELFDLCFTYSYLITIFLSVSGFYVLAYSFAKNKKYIFVLLLFILFTENLYSFTPVHMNYQLFGISFGVAESIAYCCFTLYCFFRILYNDNSKWNILLLSLLFYFVAVGLKGPIAMVLLIGIAIGCFYLIVVKRVILFGVICGISFVVVFSVVLVSFLIDINVPPVSEGARDLVFSVTDTLFHLPFCEKAYFYLCNAGLWSGLSFFIVLMAFSCCVYLIPLLLFIFIPYGKYDYKSVILGGVFLGGLLLGIFLSQKGGASQNYFIYISFVSAYYLIYSIVPVEGIPKRNENILCCVFVIGLLSFCYNYYALIYSGAVSFIQTTRYASYVSRYQNVKSSGLTVSKEEWNGLRWGRDSLPSDAVVLSNKILAEGGDRSFLVSSLSERQAFFEGYKFSNIDPETAKRNVNLIELFFKNNNDAFVSLKKDGATHAVVFKSIEPNSYPPICKVVFENNDIVIVKL